MELLQISQEILLTNSNSTCKRIVITPGVKALGVYTTPIIERDVRMELNKYLKILVEDIHSTVVATNDKNGHPIARVIDIMLYDENGLYFLTAKGKEFYSQLMEQEYIAISGMTGGAGTMNKKSVSVHGKVKNIGKEKLDEIFEKNPYMAEIYPEISTREALEVFWLYEGNGEFFDLSTKPIIRESFTIGNVAKEVHGYFITDRCRGCKICFSKCPQKCIDISKKPLVIHQENCLHCGNCMKYCPFGAVEKR